MSESVGVQGEAVEVACRCGHRNSDHFTAEPRACKKRCRCVSQESPLPSGEHHEADAVSFDMDRATVRLGEIERDLDGIPYTPPEVIAADARALFMLASAALGEIDRLRSRPVTVPTAQSGDDEMGHAEMEELIYAAGCTYCGYSDGSGDDGNPAFALIQIEGQWTAVCALHAQAAAAGEVERNYEPAPAVPTAREGGNELQQRLRVAANVAFRGPNDTDASLLAGAAWKLDNGYEAGGSNVKAAIARVLRVVAEVVSS